MVGWKQNLTNGMIKKLRVGCVLYGFRAFCFCLSAYCFFCIGLKKKKEEYEAQLEKLGSIREMQLKESEMSGKISGLEKKIQYAEIEKVFNWQYW